MTRIVDLHEEKSQWKTEILLKMDIYSGDDTFETSKPGNSNSLRGSLYYETVSLKLIEEETQCQKKVCGYFSHPLDERHRTSPEALGPVDIVETRAKDCSKSFNH